MKRAATYVYSLAAWLFVLGVVVQVFLAGLVVVARTTTWEVHTGLGHTLGLPLLLMLLTMYLGKRSARRKRLTWLLFGVYLIQADFVIFLRESFPLASALHPVLALIDFALGWRLARSALPQRRPVGIIGGAAEAVVGD